VNNVAGVENTNVLIQIGDIAGITTRFTVVESCSSTIPVQNGLKENGKMPANNSFHEFTQRGTARLAEGAGVWRP
jgi:hypothetical protein